MNYQNINLWMFQAYFVLFLDMLMQTTLFGRFSIKIKFVMKYTFYGGYFLFRKSIWVDFFRKSVTNGQMNEHNNDGYSIGNLAYALSPLGEYRRISANMSENG